jgi:hypothetical protein
MLAAATDENLEGAICGRHAAVQLEPPEAAPPPGQRSGGFCQLVRAVRRATSALLDLALPTYANHGVPTITARRAFT